MITVVIPTKNDEAALARMLPQLVHELVRGPVTDVIVYDHDSTDGTHVVCDVAGCGYFNSSQDTLSTALAKARADWLLFLPPGAVLSAGWSAHVSEYIEANQGHVGPAVFKIATEPGKNWWQRLLAAPKKQHPVLPRGYLISLRQARSSLNEKTTITDLVRGRAAKRLRAEIYVPSYNGAATAG
jgi:glycosyltransferase involved in cell wall biosynthesis